MPLELEKYRSIESPVGLDLTAFKTVEPPDQTHGASGSWGASAGEQALGRFAKGLVGGVAGPLESIGIAATGLARKFGDPILQQDEYKVEDRPTYQLGKYLRRKTAEFLPVDETRPSTFLGDVLPEGAGSMISFMAGGLAGKAAKAGGAATVAALGAGATGADAFDEAKKKGASDDDAFKVFAINAGLGTTEAVPIGGWLARLNKASGNKLTRAIREGSEEAVQEIFQQYGSNLAAQKYYDPERTWDQGLAVGGAAGFTLGSLMSLVVSAIGGRRARLTQPEEGVPDAIGEGQVKKGGFTEYFGASPQLQTEGENRNVAPQELAPSPTASSSDLTLEGRQVAQKTPQAVAPVLAPTPVPVEAKAPVTLWKAERKVGDIKEGASLGVFLTDSEQTANSLADLKGKVEQVAVQLSKPLVFKSPDGTEYFDSSEINAQLQAAGVKFEFDDTLDGDEFWRWVDDGGKPFINALKKAGYDSIQFPEFLGGKDQTTTLLFNHERAGDTYVSKAQKVAPQNIGGTVQTGQTVIEPPPGKVEVVPKSAPEPVTQPALVPPPPETPKQAPPSAPAQRVEMPHDIVRAILERGAGRLSLQYARTIQKGFKPVGVARNVFTAKGGRNLDDMLDGFHREGLFLNIQDEQHFLDALNAVSGQRKAFRDEPRRERKLMRREVEELKDFTNIALRNKRAKGKQVDAVAVDDLLTGDAFKVDGEDFVVKELVFDPETAELEAIIAQDGKRFGVQRIAGQQTLYADKGSIVQHEPSTEFLDPQEQAQLEQKAQVQPGPLPKLRRGETQGDVFATQTEDLALVGEKGKDFERIQREAAEAAKRKAEAEAANIAAHKDLFGPLNAANIWRDNILDSLATWQNKGTPQQLLAHLARTRGAMDEAAWIGLDEFLKGKASVTKAEVEQFVKANQVQVNEVMAGGDVDRSQYSVRKSTVKDLWDAFDSKGNYITSAPTEEGAWNAIPWFIQMMGRRIVQLQTQWRNTGSLPEAERTELAHLVSMDIDTRPKPDTKFGQWQTPGGSDYRELLLTLPEPLTTEQIKPDAQAIAQYKQSWDALSQVVNDAASRYDATQSPTAREQLDQAEAGLDRLHQMMVRDTALRMPKAQRQAPFHSPHFNQGNILAHIRFNTRTDSEGRKVLFIEEIQSDWAQQGRKRGFGEKYFSPEQLVDVKVEPGNFRGYWTVYATINGVREQILGSFSSREDADYNATVVMQKGLTQVSDTPEGPFVTKTEGYVGLVIRRMLRYAAENGYDKIAWTTGEMQNERYDLSKQIDAIKWQKLTDGNYSLDVYKDGSVLDAGIPDSIAPSDIESYVGKGVAEQILGATKGEQKIPKTPLSDDEQQRLEYLRYEKANRAVWGPARRDELSKLEAKEQGGIAKTSKETSGLITGADLRAGGTGMKSFYDRIIPNEVNKFVKKWGGRVGTTSVDAGNAPVFSGQNLDLQSVKDRVAYIRSIWEQPGRTAEGWQRWNTALDAQATQVIDAMQSGGISYIEAMQAYGSAALANELGGKFESQKAVLQVHSLELTPAMKQAAMEGMPLFGPNVPTSNVPTLVDSQPLIDRALSEGGGDAALKELAPNVRIVYGNLAPGRPAQYFNGVITLQKSVLDFIATRWPERAQQEIQKIIAEELTHAIADVVLTREEYLGIESEMSEQDRRDILSERPELAQQPYHIGAEYFAKRILSENEQSRPIDPNSTFGQRILAALQKIWDYLTAALKRFQGRNTVIEQALAKVRKAKADVLAGKTPTFEQGEALNAKALAKAMETFPETGDLRTIRMGQAGEIVAVQPLVQQFVQETRATAAGPEKTVQATTPQERLIRDVAQRVLSQPIVRNQLVGPVDTLNLSIHMADGDFADLERIRRDVNATDEEVSAAGGHALDTLRQLESAAQVFNGEYLKERELLLKQMSEYAEEEMSAMDQRDVDGVLFKQFRKLGRAILDQSVDAAGLKALDQAQTHSTATLKVLKFLRQTQVLAGLQLDDNRSIDDLVGYIRNNIVSDPSRFPNYDGSTFDTQVTSAVGVGMDAIRDVLRIVRLSEPLRTEIAQSKDIASGSQYAQPFHKIKARVLADIAKGNLASAFNLYENGLVEVGITLKESRDSAHFYARKFRQAVVNIKALDGAKAIIDQLNSDPAFLRQKREVQEFMGIKDRTITKEGTTDWFDNVDLSKPRIGIVWERTLADREGNVKRAQGLYADYTAYIGVPDAPGYNEARAEGMRRALMYLRYYLDPSRDLSLGRLVPSGMVKLADHIGSVFGHPQLIPKYSFTGAAGPAYEQFNLTMVALSDVLEREVTIEKQYAGRRKQLLGKAIASHTGMTVPMYHSEILDPIAASRQNFNDPYVLKVGDGIGNGHRVTKEDIEYLNLIKQFQNELLQVVNNYGRHKFESASRIFSGILLDGGKQTRLPYSRGPDMVPRSFPDQLENWVRAWAQAVSPEQKMDFLNQNLTRFIISYINGVGQSDYDQPYAYRLPMKEVLRTKGSDRIKSFQDLVERITHLHNADSDNKPITLDEARDTMLGEIGAFIKRGADLLPKRTADEKMQLEITGGDSEFNAERKQAVMPLGMYNYGVVTDAEVAGALRGASWAFVNAHLNAGKALEQGLESDIKQFEADAAQFGIKTVQQQAKEEAAHGLRLYNWGQTAHLKEMLSNYMTQIQTAVHLSANPFMMDRPHQVLQNSVAKFIVTSLVAAPSPLVRNLAGGFAQIAAFNAEVRRMSLPHAFASASGQMISGTFKELMFQLTHDGNPATRKIRSFMESKEGRILTLGFSKWIADMANERRALHDYTAQIVGVNLNQKFWENTKGQWALWRTKGMATDVMPPTMRQWLNGVSLSIDTLANFIGHATVGYADSRINSASVYLVEKAEREFEEIAMRWGDKRMPNGLFPDKALARRLFGLDYGTATPATRIREWFRNSGIGSIDQLMEGYYDRMKAWEAAGKQGQKPRLFTDPQFVQTVMATSEDNNLATFRSRPPLFKQSKLHSTLGILFGYPFFLLRKILSFTNVMNNQGFLRRHGENIPLALTIALLIALTAVLGNELASKLIKRNLENKVTGFPTLSDATTPAQAAQAVLFATADAVPIIGSAFNAMMGVGYAKGFDLNSQFLMLNLASDAMKTSKEILQTGAIGRPMLQFASRYTFPANVVGSRLPVASGLRDFTNARNVLSMGARGTGLETKLRRPGTGISSQNYSASTPLINEWVNAIGNNDAEGAQKAYNALVEQKRRSGSLNPASAALSALRSRSPVLSVFGSRPDPADLDRVYANLPSDLAARARSTVNRFDAAIAALPRGGTTRTRTTGRSRLRAGSGASFRLRRPRLRLRMPRLQPPRLRRLAA